MFMTALRRILDRVKSILAALSRLYSEEMYLFDCQSLAPYLLVARSRRILVVIG